MVQAKAKKIINSFTDILKSPEMQILPGQIAFYLVMAIIPIATITAAFATYVTHSFNFIDSVGAVLPPALTDILAYLSRDMRFQGVAFVLAFYILVGSNAPGSIIIASNILYDIKQPRYIKRKLKSFVMTIIIVLLLLFVILIPLFGDIIVQFVVKITHSRILDNYRVLYEFIKAFGSFVIMYFIIKLLYTYAPSKKIDRRTTTKGSLFTSIGWIIATYLYAFYITDIASYDVVYGNFANVLILLLWVYILAYLFVVGMALNVEDFHKQRMWEDEKKEKREDKSKGNKK